MQFDSYTVMAASGAIFWVLGAVILLLWRRNKAAVWLGWWASAFFMIGVSSILLMMRSTGPEAEPVPLGTGVLVIGFGLLWQGARVFDGRKPSLWPVGIFAAWLTLLLVLPIHTSVVANVILASVPLAMMLWLSAFELWRGRSERLPSRCLAVINLGAVGALFAARVPLAPLLPFPMGGLPSEPLWVGLFNGPVLIAALLLGVLFISMTMERMEIGQRTLAQLDPLTGLCNRRAMQDIFEDEMVPEGTSIVVFDLDRFKVINDTYGHGVGDEFLRRFGSVCQKNIRQIDTAVRLGGEEFVVIMPESDAHTALEIAERVRRMFAKETVSTESGPVKCTVSAGIEISTGGGVDLETLLTRADVELYRAKNSGRNKVCHTIRSTAA